MDRLATVRNALVSRLDQEWSVAVDWLIESTQSDISECLELMASEPEDFRQRATAKQVEHILWLARSAISEASLRFSDRITTTEDLHGPNGVQRDL